jgi:hypothetical protein
MFRTESKSTARFRTVNAPDGIPPVLAQGGAGRNGACLLSKVIEINRSKDTGITVGFGLAF